MSVVVPQNPKDEAYIVNASGLASFHGPWFDSSLCHEVGFTASWGAFAATAGTLSIEGTDDPSQAAANVVTLTISSSHGTWPTVGTGAANAMVRLSNPPHFVRMSYTRGAGGTTNQFQVFAHGRSI